MSVARVHIGALRLRLPARDAADARALAREVVEQLRGLDLPAAGATVPAVALRIEARAHESRRELASRVARAIAARIPGRAPGPAGGRGERS